MILNLFVWFVLSRPLSPIYDYNRADLRSCGIEEGEDSKTAKT